MKVALLATLLTFAGSLAGFAAVTAGSPAAPEIAAKPAVVEQVIVQKDRDCPKGGRAEAA